MMYYTILASFCLLGMARSQTDPTLTACLTKEQNLRMECVFIPTKQANATCTFEVDKKVVATNVANKQQDPTYTNRASIKLESNKCVLNLKGLTDDSKTFNCTVQQEKLASAKMTVEKKTTDACSAGNTLKHGGVILLLAFVLPFLSGML